MQTLFRNVAAVFFFGLSPLAHAQAMNSGESTITVGGVSLKIPAPAGTKAISRGSETFNTIQAALPQILRLEGAYYPVETASKIEAGEPFPPGPFFQVQINKTFEAKRFSPADFSQLSKATVSELNASMKDADFGKKEIEKGAQRLNDRAGTDLKLKPGVPEFLTPHLSEERMVAFSFRMSFQVAAAGIGAGSESLTGSGAIVHVRGKAVQLYAYAPGLGVDALDSSRKSLKDWADAIIAANPSGGQDEVSNVAMGFDWGRALRTGAIWGIIGAIVGVFVWLAKKRTAV